MMQMQLGTTAAGRNWVRFSMACLFTLSLPLFFGSLLGCQQQDAFDEGHEWIIPRPAAEIRVTVLDDRQEPLPDATLWILIGGEKIEDASRLIAYDPQMGLKTGADGLVVIHYLGETGGGFEVPLNAPPQPTMELLVEAPSKETRRVDLDTRLFRSEHQVGETTLTHENETVVAKIIVQTISFADE